MPADNSNYSDEPEPQGDGGEKTSTAPKSAFPSGCKPGDKYEITITGVSDSEVQFSVSGAEEQQEEPAEQKQPQPEEGGGMRSLLED